jgi:hypothetical protein
MKSWGYSEKCAATFIGCIFFMLALFVVVCLGISCAQLNSSGQEKAAVEAQNTTKCMRLANECFTRLYQGSQGDAQLVQSCLWSWQSWRCHELVKGAE